jgi:hypothetical protein
MGLGSGEGENDRISVPCRGAQGPGASGPPSLAPGILTPGFPSRGPGPWRLSALGLARGAIPDSWGPGSGSPGRPSSPVSSSPVRLFPSLPSFSLVRLVSRPCPSSSPVRPSPVLSSVLLSFRPLPSVSSPARPSLPSSPVLLPFRPSLLPFVLLPSFPSPVLSRPLRSLSALSRGSGSGSLLFGSRDRGSGLGDSGLRIQDSGIGRSVLRQDKKRGPGRLPQPPVRQASQSQSGSDRRCPLVISSSHSRFCCRNSANASLRYRFHACSILSSLILSAPSPTASLDS